MFEKFVAFIDAVSGVLVGLLVFIFALGFLVSLLLGNWNAATAFGIGHIGVWMLAD